MPEILQFSNIPITKRQLCCLSTDKSTQQFDIEMKDIPYTYTLTYPFLHQLISFFLTEKNGENKNDTEDNKMPALEHLENVQKDITLIY